MARSALSLALAFAFGSAGCASDAVENDVGGEQPLAIATWNVQNFVNDRVDDVLLQPQQTPEQLDPDYLQRMAAIGERLREANPDVIVLQEIEHDRLAAELNERELGGEYPHIAHFDGNDPRGIDILVMSKLPIDESFSHQDESLPGVGNDFESFSRDVLHVRMTVNGQPLRLLGVHFKAKEVPPDGDPEGADRKRLAEAQRTRFIADLVERGVPGVSTIVVGDYNDVPGSAPVEAVRGADYFDVLDYIPEGERFTFVFNGTPEAIDHQMVNVFGQQFLRGGTIYRANGASDHDLLLGFYEIAAPQ